MNRFRLWCHVWLLLMAVTLLMVGCVASRRAQSSVSSQAKDSLVDMAKDSMKAQKQVQDSVVIVTDDSTNRTFTYTENGDGEETIHEHITEQTDAAGNKTTTTDRTTQRKNGYQKHGNYDETIRHQQSEIAALKKTVDSLAVINKSNVGLHWASKDSLGASKDKNTDEVKSKGKASKSDIAWCVSCLSLVLFVGILLYRKYKVIQYEQERKQRQGRMGR